MNAKPGTRILFLDMDNVEVQHNVTRRVLEATKHPANPLLPLGDVHEWDSLQAAPWASRTVLYDEEEGLFKCWYAGTDLSTERWWATGYAYSEDGINWTKPRLGLFEYNGNRDNNICVMDLGPVIKDPGEDDPNKRYKMLKMGLQRERGIRAGYSSDGLHWQEGARIDLPEWEGGRPDMVVLLRDDQDPDPNRRYKFVWQRVLPSNKPGPEGVRTKYLGYGPDIEHFEASKLNPILHPNDGLEHENHFLMLAPYCGQYVMLYEYGWYTPNGSGNFGSYCADIRLATSRDGERYERINPHEKIIPRGPRGAWDGGFLVISDKPVIKGDTIYLYYAGNGEDWTSWPGSNKHAGYRFTSTGCVRSSRMGLATLRRDGFTCLQTTDGETPGFASTRPIDRVAGDIDLVANVGCTLQNRSWVEVEVLDPETGDPMAGFTRADCCDISRDGTQLAVRWGDRGIFNAPKSPFKLRFWIYGAARLHAFGFEPGGLVD